MISQQGSEKVPHSVAGKILFLIGFLFGLLCFSSFSANIVTELTNVKSLKSFEELVNYTPIKQIPPNFKPFASEISISNSPPVKQLWARSLEDKSSYGCSEAPRCDFEIIKMIFKDQVKEFAYSGPGTVFADMLSVYK